MLGKRIIPCLDISQGKVVKGVNFINLKDVGDPMEIARGYSNRGADELVLLNITASSKTKDVFFDLVTKVARNISIPLIVGGGIETLEDCRDILQRGADRICINSSALKNPQLVSEGAKRFGNTSITVAIDAKRNDKGGFNVFMGGGRINTGRDVLNWAVEVERRGAGEILLTSMDSDGTKDGYDVELTGAVTREVDIPVIASGGAGSLVHFADVIKQGGADAALAASLFHYNELEIIDIKKYLAANGISVRLEK